MRLKYKRMLLGRVPAPVVVDIELGHFIFLSLFTKETELENSETVE